MKKVFMGILDAAKTAQLDVVMERAVAVGEEVVKFAAAVQGFVTFSVTKDSIYLQFIDHKDKIIHQTTINK